MGLYIYCFSSSAKIFFFNRMSVCGHKEMMSIGAVHFMKEINSSEKKISLLIERMRAFHQLFYFVILADEEAQ